MPTRSSSLGNNISTAVDREIGSQYDNVRVVAENIESVVTVADHIENVDTVATNIVDVHAVGGSIVDVRTVATNINSVIAVEQDIVNIDIVVANVDSIDAIVTDVIPNITEIVNASANAAIATTKAQEASVSAAAALVSEQNAKASELAAGVSEDNAAASEVVAVTKAGEASASATAARNSELAAAAMLDAFDDRYLGSFTVDPTTDNDGQPLLDGALYFNTSENVLKVYDVGTTTWYTIPQTLLSSLLDVQLTSVATGDILNWNGTKWVNTSSVREHIADTSNPHSVTKVQVGLGNVDNTADVDKNVLSATKWATARTISSTGDVTWETTLDGSVDATGVATLANSGIVAGTYNNSATAVKPLIVDAKGRITDVGLDVTITPAWSSITSTPTTISGYGITDAYTKTETDSALSLKAPLASPVLTGTPTAPTATVGDSSTRLATTAFVNAKIADYTYSKTEINTKLATQNDASEISVTPSGNLASTNVQTALEELQGDIDIRYTKTEADTLLAGKVDDSLVVHKTGDETIAGVKTLADGLKLQDRNVSPFSGFKNYIINGNFDVWQYGTSQTCTSTAFQYGSVDRFCLINTEATNYTISRVPTDGTEPFSANYFARNVVPLNTTTGIVLDQHIENLKRFSNKTVTLSMWVKGDAGKKIRFGYQAVYGAGGTPSAPDSILGKVFILTGSWQKVVMTTTLPDVITGKTYGTNDNSFLRLSIVFSSGSTTYIPEIFFQSGTFDIAQVQLEEGSVATPFENRPYGLELSLCQRYLPVLFADNSHFSGAASSSTAAIVNIPFPVSTRVPPTGVSISSPTSSYIETANGSLISTTGMSLRRAGMNSCSLTISVASGLTVGQACSFIPSGSKILFTGCEL